MWRSLRRRTDDNREKNRWFTGDSLSDYGAHGYSHAIICHPVKQE